MSRTIQSGKWYCATCGKPLGNISLEEHYRLECDRPVTASERQKVEELEKRIATLESEVKELQQVCYE